VIQGGHSPASTTTRPGAQAGRPGGARDPLQKRRNACDPGRRKPVRQARCQTELSGIAARRLHAHTPKANVGRATHSTLRPMRRTALVKAAVTSRRNAASVPPAHTQRPFSISQSSWILDLRSLRVDAGHQRAPLPDGAPKPWQQAQPLRAWVGSAARQGPVGGGRSRPQRLRDLQ